MKADATDITVVLDRSGSMASCRLDAEGGLNHFVEEQKKLPGSAAYSLVQFNTEYEFVHRGVDIKTVGPHTLMPRGGTALLDAVGRAINETGERLNGMAEADRPGLVVFVILTDGQENSSREFKLAQIRDMIRQQSEVYKWQFTFLGANQDAFAEAGAMGIPSAAAANYTPQNSAKAFTAAAANVGRMRAACRAGKPIVSSYSDKERRLMAE